MLDQIININRDYESSVSSQVSLMFMRFVNVCIKTDPMVLVPIKISIYGKETNIDDVAQVAIIDDDNFCLIPFQESHIPQILESIKLSHPEFSFDIQRITEDGLKPIDDNLEELGENERKVLIITVPEVNEDRRDTLNDACDVLYDNCKAKTESFKVDYTQRMTEATASFPENLKKEALDMLKKTEEQNTNLRDTTYNNKKQEIEEAYQRYLAKQESKANMENDNVVENDETDGGSSFDMSKILS